MIQRRGFLAGIGTLLAAPAIIRTPGLLMPVKAASIRALTLGEIVTTTLRSREGMLVEIVMKNNVLLAQINARYAGYPDFPRPSLGRGPQQFWRNLT